VHARTHARTHTHTAIILVCDNDLIRPLFPLTVIPCNPKLNKCLLIKWITCAATTLKAGLLCSEWRLNSRKTCQHGISTVSATILHSEAVLLTQPSAQNALYSRST
jgi:hypothetical protein